MSQEEVSEGREEVPNSLRGERGIPSAAELYAHMDELGHALYSAWKSELAGRIMELELRGYINKDHIDVPHTVWRLPNEKIKGALADLTDDLEELGYKPVFHFENIDGDYGFALLYEIELPELYDEPTLCASDGDSIVADPDVTDPGTAQSTL